MKSLFKGLGAFIVMTLIACACLASGASTTTKAIDHYGGVELVSATPVTQTISADLSVMNYEIVNDVSNVAVSETLIKNDLPELVALPVKCRDVDTWCNSETLIYKLPAWLSPPITNKTFSGTLTVRRC